MASNGTGAAMAGKGNGAAMAVLLAPHSAGTYACMHAVLWYHSDRSCKDERRL
jgi:hypothetical protein